MTVEMVSYRDLSELKLTKLDTAVTKWKGIKDEFHDIATGEGRGADVVRLEKQATGADWTGANAELSKQFVVEAAREFHDAAEQAKSIHLAVKLSRQRMQKHQSDLQKKVEDIRDEGLHVAGDGKVSDSEHYTDEGKRKAAEEKIKAAEARIEKVLKAAASTQHDLAEGLRLLVQDAHDFSGADYGSYDDIRKIVGRADADKAIDEVRDLYKQAKNGDRVNLTKLDSFNDLAELQRSNPAFAKRLTTQLGAKDTLLFWRMMCGDGFEITNENARGRQLVRLRDNLGMTLATASRQRGPDIAKWKDDVLWLGRRPISNPGHPKHDPSGFQVMSSLMGKGRFDTDFLRDYGKELREYDKKAGDKGKAWFGTWSDLDPSSSGRGADPMAGFLKAASHNPAFATELFENEDTADYYLKDRTYLPDNPQLGDGKNRAAEALGDALYAGGSGMNPDDPGAEYVEHTADQNKAFHNIFDRLALKKNDMMPELREGMALLLGNHGDETYETMNTVYGQRTPLDQDKLMEITKQISRSPEGYAALNQAMNQSMVHDIMTQKDHPTLSAEQVGRALGFQVEARHQAIDEMTAAEQKSAGWKSFWTYLGVAEASTAPKIGPFSAHIANTAFGISKWWTEDEQAQIAEDGTLEKKSVSAARGNQLRAFARLWLGENGEYAGVDDEWGSEKSVLYKIDQAANAGKHNAERILDGD
ncbi:hypothetical protein [Streptomyces sp. NPDC006925]|uniref:hypothetical protein n=2 Tax=unclassified Streptomyces TaxID=2593676 RepID=UPI0036AEE041